MKPNLSCPDTATKTQLEAQIALSERLRTFPAELLRETQAQMLKSRLQESQTDAIALFVGQAKQAVAELDAKANAAAMKALLTPQDAQQRVRAFFHHAKARATEFGLLQFDASLGTATGSFAEFVADVSCGQEACRSSHLTQAAGLTRALLGKDPTTEEYAAMRNDAAQAQGREEAYADLLELFEQAMAAANRVPQ
jgi:hypothetical protein